MAKSPENEADYQKFQQLALSQLHQTQRAIIIGGIFPLIMIALNAINLFVAYRWLEFWESPDVEVFARLSPILIGIILSVLATVQWVFLISWRRKKDNYDKMKDQKYVPSEAKPPSETKDFIIKKDRHMSLTALIYALVKYMSKIQVLFFIILIVGCVNIAWSLWFLVDSWVYRIFWIPLPYFTHIWILNGILVAIIIGFMFFEANLFRKWNTKLKRLSAYENEVLKELGLD